MQRLLVTGASGFLGWNICRSVSSQWHVVGTVFSHPVAIDGCDIRQVDVRRSAELRSLFREIKPDAVIHTAAASQPNFCQQNPDQSRSVNVDATVLLATLCAESSIPFAFTSTDLVFSGDRAPYTETDATAPISIYGEQKVSAERAIRAIYPDAAICRMPLMFGDPSPDSSNSLLSMIADLKRRKSVSLFSDEYRTPLCALSATTGLLMALEKVHGTIHLGGCERISRYEFGCKVALHCGFDPALVRPIAQNSILSPAPRPRDVSLNSDRARNLGFSPLPVSEELQRLQILAQISDSRGACVS